MTASLHRAVRGRADAVAGRAARDGARVRRRRVASSALAALLAATQALVPVARAQDDVTPPSIDHEPIREIAAGGRERVEARVTDDGRGVERVTLNLGLGDGGFEALAMEREDDARYAGTLSAEGLAEGERLRYYITAVDEAGNEQSRGFEFDPLVVEVGPPAVAAPVAADEGGRTIWYVAAGALVLGLVASLAGGGGGGSRGGSDVDGPSLPTLGTSIVVR